MRIEQTAETRFEGRDDGIDEALFRLLAVGGSGEETRHPAADARQVERAGEGTGRLVLLIPNSMRLPGRRGGGIHPRKDFLSSDLQRTSTEAAA